MGSRGNFDHHGLRWTLGGGGYQFYTTSPNVQWAIYEKPDVDFFPGGSSVYVPTPEVFLNSDGTIDYEKSVIKAFPIGSTVEEPTSNNKWNYFGPTPNSLSALNNIMNVSMFKVSPVWQINGIPENVYYSTVLRVTEAPLPINKPLYDVKYKLFNAYVQPEGQIYGFNAFCPVDPTRTYSLNYIGGCDILFDANPGKITKNITTKAPDTDWPGRACITMVGGKAFVIMHDSKNDWYCWPDDAVLDLRGVDGVYGAEYITYGSQFYKANVIPSNAKKVEVDYPPWVHKGISFRNRYIENPGLIFEPRYSFSFNSTGTKAIGVMVERKPSQCKFYKIDYTTASLNNYTPTPIPLSCMPIEEEIDPIQLGPSYDRQDVQEDRLGMVELSFDITLKNGVFSFDVNVSDSVSPDEIAKLDKGALVNVAFARALDWSQKQSMGFPLTQDDFAVNKDDVLSCFIEMFWHKEQKGLVTAFDGEPSLNVPSKTKATFYKGNDFSGKLFCIPLSQSHGKGYTYSTIDPEIALPEPPHKFVWNTNQTLSSLYPYTTKEGYSESLYYYSAYIEQMELASLSFYYTIRVVEETRALADNPRELLEGTPYEDYKFYDINTRSKTMCMVCVMGRYIDANSAGSDKISDSWIYGWVQYSGNEPVDEDEEEKIPLDLIGNIRGIGNAPNVSSSGRYEYIPPNYRGIGSWINATPPDGIWNKVSDLGSHPWWMTGPCGHLVHLALSLGVMAEWYGSSYTVGDFTETYPTPGSLFGMTKDSMADLLAFIWDLSSSFIGSISDKVYTTEYSGEDFFSTNPFPLSCIGMTKEIFIENNQTYLWLLVKDLQSSVPRSPIISVGSGSAVMKPMSLNVFGASVLSRGGGLIEMNNYNKFFPEYSGTGNLSPLAEKKNIVKNIELGTLYYNHAINRHFLTKQINTKSKILVTPEGHISYSKKDCYDITKQYCATEIGYATGCPMHSDGDYSPVIINLEYLSNDTSTFIEDDITWKQIEGLSWFYGKIKTKHIYVYALAYQDYSDYENRKKSLRSEEAYYANKYSEVDFMPDFRFTTLDGYWWIYPMEFEDGQRRSVHEFSLARECGMHNTSDASRPSHDPRPKTTFIRLSPLFF